MTEEEQASSVVRNDYRGSKVAIFGGTGFIGSRFTRALAQQGAQVLVVTRQQNKAQILQGNIPSVSVLTWDRVSALNEFAPDVIFHASFPGREHIAENSSHTMLTDIVAVTKDTRARLVYLSSAAVYGEAHAPVSEDALLRPVNPYGRFKYAEEIILQDASRQGMDILMMRIFNLFGPGQPDNFLVPAVLKQLQDPHKEDVDIANPDHVRDYLHVDDCVQAMLLASARAGRGTVFNIGSGRGTATRELAHMIMACVNIYKPLNVVPREDAISYSVADISRISSTGWRPEQSLAGALRRTIDAYQKK